MTQEQQTLLTPEVKALIGQTTEVIEMYGVIDLETIRRYVIGIPDQDPRHWDEELAKPRYGGITSPGLMVSYVAGRKPPWEPDHLHEDLLTDWFRDGASMARQETGLPSIRSVAKTRSHLHAGDEVEIYRYPKLGDRIFYQSTYNDIQEKKDHSGRPFLLLTRETRYWDQDNETICIVRTLGIER
jgi:N-terminal half of MaoC dehydratase